MSLRQSILHTAERIAEYRATLDAARVYPSAGDVAAARDALSGRLPYEGTPARDVIDALAAAVTPALCASSGPRYFGFVTGGALDAALCADLLTAGWDQNAFNAVTSPAAALVEEVVSGWLKELLGLPATASSGFVTGGQAANTVGLAAARHHVLGAAGWDVERDGLWGAPRVRVIGSVERHATIDRSLRLLGFGTAIVEEVRSTADGSIDVAHLAETLARREGLPTIVCLQAGNVNTGACDDFALASEAARRHGAWVHIDGAFGLWAAANPSTRGLMAGIERADSWACDGHKWLNVPYDSGYVFCAHPEAHRAAMSFNAAYLSGHGQGDTRHPADFVPESSRRARGFATWAALRQLGKRDVERLIEQSCEHAREFSTQLRRAGVNIGNEVVLNQVLCHFTNDAITDRVILAAQQEGTCWLGGTTWHGKRYMRISVSNASTTRDDVQRTVGVLLELHEREKHSTPP